MAGIGISNGTGTASNYTLTGGTHSFTINRRVVSLSGGSRQYNGSATAIAADLPTINNLVGSETLTLSGNGVVENANVGDNKPLTNLSGLTLQNGSNGGLAANYTLSGGSSIISITPRILSLDGSRVYDGTTNSNSSDLTISNLVGSETVSLSGFGTVTSGNVGTNKTITLNTLSISDGSGSASNYTLTGGTHTYDITSRAVTYSGTKVYDGSTLVNGSDLTTISNLATGESLSILGSGSISSANVGTGKSVTTGTLSLQNGTGLASNYTLGSGTFDVTQRWINITGNKSYDGSTSVTAGSLALGNLVSGESLTISGSGSVSSSSVGSDKAITLGTLALGNTGSGTASNYTFGNTSFEITRRVLNASGSRAYNGSTNVTSSDLTLNNLAGSETITFSGSGTISSAEVENNKSVTSDGFSISNGSGAASNYTLSGGSFTLSVTTRPLTLSGSSL